MSSELKKASVGPAFIGAIILFVLFVLLLKIWFAINGHVESLDEKRASARLARLDVLNKDNDVKLQMYAWINKDKGIVQLPIERAEELVVGELKAKTVHASSVKVDNPYPYGLQQPVAAAATSGTAASGTATSGTAAPAASVAPQASPVAAAAPSPAASTTPAASPAPSAAASPAASPAPAQ